MTTTTNEHTERAELTDAQIDEIAEQHATGQDDQDRYIVTTAELHEIIKDAAALLEVQPDTNPFGHLHTHQWIMRDGKEVCLRCDAVKGGA